MKSDKDGIQSELFSAATADAEKSHEYDSRTVFQSDGSAKMKANTFIQTVDIQTTDKPHAKMIRAGSLDYYVFYPDATQRIFTLCKEKETQRLCKTYPARFPSWPTRLHRMQKGDRTGRDMQMWQEEGINDVAFFECKLGLFMFWEEI